MSKNIKTIAVTINLDIHYLSNGLQQNILFLVNCLNNIQGKKCIILYHGKLKKYDFLKKEYSISYEEYYSNNNKNFDLVIYAGFVPSQEKHSFDKNRNKNTKFILIQYGNELADCIHFSLDSSFKQKPKNDVFPLDEIWTSPHHIRNIPFLKTKYDVNNVKVAPFLWDDSFLLKQFYELGIDKNIEEFKSNIDINKVTIFEPNISFMKTSLVPVFILERFEKFNPNILKSCSILCGDRLIKNEYFPNIIANLDIFKKRKDFLKCYKRFPFLASIYNLGGLIISHQILCELNYLYLEALYLSLPLIHNSNLLKNYGYYYEEFDIIKAEKHIKYILENHKRNIELYSEKNNELFKKLSPNCDDNIQSYNKLIEELNTI